MFEIDTILSLFVSLLLIYDASNALRAPEHIVNAQPACAKVVLSSKAAGAGGAAGALQPPSTVLICSNYPLGARLASSHPGLWMTIICESSVRRSAPVSRLVADYTRHAVFGLMILSVILICIFRLAASRSARRSILETLRFAVMGCLTSTFLCGIETTLLLALPLHARLTLEPLDRPLIRTWYVNRTTHRTRTRTTCIGPDSPD